MSTYYVTFGQNHPLRNGWVEIIAPTYEMARKAAFDIFGTKFAFIRETNDIDSLHGYFPAGRYGEVIDLSHVSE